ncbi:MAG: hypothetical protein ACKO96_05040 [Flammeovirgaceae bacterium]
MYNEIMVWKSAETENEAFCHYIVQGFTQANAYLKSRGENCTSKFETAKAKGCELANRPKIKARIAQIRQELSEVHFKTSLDILNDIEVARVGAIEDKQFAPAISASKLQAEMLGVAGVKNVDVTSKGESIAKLIRDNIPDGE